MKKLLIFLVLLSFGCTHLDRVLEKNYDDLDSTLKKAEQTKAKWSTYGDMGDGTVAAGDTFLIRDIDDPTLSAITGTQKQYQWADVVLDLDALYETLDATIMKTDEAETITADHVNTDNPWVDNEVANLQTLKYHRLQILTAEPDDEALFDIARADGATWDPSGSGLTIDHLVICTATGDPGTWVLYIDETAKLYFDTVQAKGVTSTQNGNLTIDTDAEINKTYYTTGNSEFEIADAYCDAAGDVGNWVRVINGGAHTVAIDVHGDHTIEKWDTAAFAAGDKIVVDAEAGAMCMIECVAADTWVNTGDIGVCTDGGP